MRACLLGVFFWFSTRLPSTCVYKQKQRRRHGLNELLSTLNPYGDDDDDNIVVNDHFNKANLLIQKYIIHSLARSFRLRHTTQSAGRQFVGLLATLATSQQSNSPRFLFRLQGLLRASQWYGTHTPLNPISVFKTLRRVSGVLAFLVSVYFLQFSYVKIPLFCAPQHYWRP